MSSDFEKNINDQNESLVTEEKDATQQVPQLIMTDALPDDEEEQEMLNGQEANDPLLAFLNPTFRTVEDIEGSKQKKKRTLIISLVAAFAVLAIAIVLLLFVFPKKEKEDTTLETDTTVTLFDKTDETVACEISSATFESETQKVEVINKEGQLFAKGYEELAVHTVNMNALEDLLTKLIAADDIGEVSDLKEYGLDTPQLTVSVTYHDNSKKVFEIGDMAPDQSGCYMREKDSMHLYILDIDSVSILMQDALKYVSTTVFSKPEIAANEKEESDIVLRRMSLGGTLRKDNPFAFRLVTSEDSNTYIYYNYIITEPAIKGSNAKYDTDLKAFTSLTASSVVKAYPTDADLKEYGLDEPWSTLTFTLAKRTTTSETDENGNTVSKTTHKDLIDHTIRISEAPNENYYVMIDDVPIVYLVNSTQMAFADMGYDDFADKLLFLEDITTISKFQITIDGKVTEFQLTHYPNIDDNEKNMTVIADGKTLDTMDFRYLMNDFMNIKRYTSLSQEVSNTPTKLEFSIYRTGETAPVLTGKFYETTGNLCAAILSSGEKYQVKTSDVEFVIEQCNNYLNGKTVLR